MQFASRLKSSLFDGKSRLVARVPARPLSIFAVSLLMLCTAEASRYFSVADNTVSAFWPPGGIMLGAALAMGPRVIMLLGPLLLLWMLGLERMEPDAALVAAGGQMLGAWLGHRLIQRVWSNRQFQTLSWGAAVYLRGALASGGVMALISSAGLFAGANLVIGAGERDIFPVFLAREALAVILFTPLTFYSLLQPRRFFRAVWADFRRGEIALWLLVALSVLAAIFIVPEFFHRIYAVGLIVTLFGLLFWFVVKAGSPATLVVIPIFAILLLVLASRGYAGLPALTSNEEVMLAITLAGGLAILGQLIATVIADRDRTVTNFRHQANTDFLTGLANDRATSAAIQSRLDRPAKDEQRQPAWLIHLDILDFDQIEDLVGFQASRTFEKLFAARLMGTVGPGAHPARIGDGVLALVIDDLSEEDLQKALIGLYNTFDGESFRVDDYQTLIRITLGAVPINGQFLDHGKYLSAATQAALMARDQMPRIQVINDVSGLIENRRTMTKRMEMLKDAISENRLVLFAQPICPIGWHDDQLTYEILLRLQDRDGEMVSPGMFLPVAEAFGFMNEIDRWVIRATLNALAGNPDWQARTRKCSVNLAGTSLSSEELVDYIKGEFERTGVPPEKIGFEVTETQHINSRPVAESITRQLRDMGCSVALDDFGTGLATFDYLKSFDFDVLKIDGAFVRGLEDNHYDRKIVQAICDVAREMGLKTVAEFVENDSVAAILAKLGVDYGQGYGLGKPVAMALMFDSPQRAS
jgi:EAL domain-containing protein (putative c-di-GMP-specific phosphodiesterase class I)